MKRFVLGFALVFICVFTTSFSADKQTPESIASAFFATVLKGHGNEALDALWASNPIFKERVQQLQLLKGQLATALQIYGVPYDVEPVSVEDITPSLQRRVYITKHEFHPLVWEMYFYKAEVGWLPDQLIFVDQYQLLGKRK